VPADATHKSAFERIYATYYAKLVRFSKEYVLSEADAENIVQDIFLAMWERRGELEEVQNMNAYLFRIVRNRCIDFLRKRVKTDLHRQPLSEVEQKEYEFKLYALNLFDTGALSDEDIEKLIADALQQLPAKCRDIFVLSRFENMSHKQIAEKFDLSPNTVNNQIHIALTKLKRELRDYLPLLLFISA
jgi:RNA polymerase sigma-70 factor (ECF subfamily)